MSNKPINWQDPIVEEVSKELSSSILCWLVNSFNDWEMAVSQLRAGQEQGSEEIQLKIVVAYNENEQLPFVLINYIPLGLFDKDLALKQTPKKTDNFAIPKNRHFIVECQFVLFPFFPASAMFVVPKIEAMYAAGQQAAEPRG